MPLLSTASPSAALARGCKAAISEDSTGDLRGQRRKSILFLGADAAYLYEFRGALMREFKRRGYHVHAVASVIGDFDPKSFSEIGVDFTPWSMSKATLSPLSDLGPIFRLWNILRRLRPDVLFTHTIKAVIYGITVGALVGIPRKTAMVPGLGYAFAPGGGLKRRIIRYLARIGYSLAMSRAELVIFQNADDREALRHANALPPHTPTGLVNGSGVDMERYAPAAWPPGPVTFLLVARLLWDKGIGEFVEAARRVRQEIPEARFVLVGGTDTNPASIPQERIDAWAAEGIIDVRGRVSDPRPEFASSHIFVLPSYYMEGCPRVSLEAMAMARPIITTDWVGCRDTVVAGINGLLVPPRNVDALAAAMLALAGDMDRARLMGEAGRLLCRERFELGAVTRATTTLVEGFTLDGAEAT